MAISSGPISLSIHSRGTRTSERSGRSVALPVSNSVRGSDSSWIFASDDQTVRGCSCHRNRRLYLLVHLRSRIRLRGARNLWRPSVPRWGTPNSAIARVCKPIRSVGDQRYDSCDIIWVILDLQEYVRRTRPQRAQGSISRQTSCMSPNLWRSSSNT